MKSPFVPSISFVASIGDIGARQTDYTGSTNGLFLKNAPASIFGNVQEKDSKKKTYNDSRTISMHLVVGKPIINISNYAQGISETSKATDGHFFSLKGFI
ncbi:hypothetical protein SAMN05421766_104413 [Zobellia uliginosa]|uniref:Uncharacterized protein n=1 Tax=Zobellia uliginosa TaxID=143224 RepID=A0ABY1KW91_9FLAO|nr:hypothetical protein [Zobellia uliginosa]SIS85671.1 hypothetical protein SAMN05421766_104413 [Zobellia uliginosa]